MNGVVFKILDLQLTSLIDHITKKIFSCSHHSSQRFYHQFRISVHVRTIVERFGAETSTWIFHHLRQRIKSFDFWFLQWPFLLRMFITVTWGQTFSWQLSEQLGNIWYDYAGLSAQRPLQHFESRLMLFIVSHYFQEMKKWSHERFYFISTEKTANSRFVGVNDLTDWLCQHSFSSECDEYLRQFNYAFSTKSPAQRKTEFKNLFSGKLINCRTHLGHEAGQILIYVYTEDKVKCKSAFRTKASILFLIAAFIYHIFEK